jgi:hypothetical protein
MVDKMIDCFVNNESKEKKIRQIFAEEKIDH